MVQLGDIVMKHVNGQVSVKKAFQLMERESALSELELLTEASLDMPTTIGPRASVMSNRIIYKERARQKRDTLRKRLKALQRLIRARSERRRVRQQIVEDEDVIIGIAMADPLFALNVAYSLL